MTRIFRITVGGIAIGLLIALVPVGVQAAELRQGPSIVVSAGETIDDDLYAGGGTIDVEGTVNGSVIVGGGNLTIGGPVSRDVMVGGGTGNITGDVKGSVRAAGGTVTISGPVGEDVLVTGGTVTLQSNAKVGRDVLVGAGTVTIAGPVTRKVLASAGDLTIDSRVGGDLKANVTTLHLGSHADIQGNVTYYSDKEATVDSGAKVGHLERRPRQGQPISQGPLAIVIGWFRALVGLFALGLIIVLLVPGVSQRTITTLRASPWASLGLGVVLLIAVPIVAVGVLILGIFVGGWWLAVFLIAAYALALAAGYVLVGLFTGSWIAQRLNLRGVHPIWMLLLGLVILTIIGLIPILGGLVSLVVLLFGLGAVFLTLARARPPAAMPSQAV